MILSGVCMTIVPEDILLVTRRTVTEAKRTGAVKTDDQIWNVNLALAMLFPKLSLSFCSCFPNSFLQAC